MDLLITEVTFPSISTVNTSAMAGGMCENPRKPEPSTTAAPQAGAPGSFGIAMGGGSSTVCPMSFGVGCEADRRRAFADVKVK